MAKGVGRSWRAEGLKGATVGLEARGLFDGNFLGGRDDGAALGIDEAGNCTDLK